MLGKIRQLLGVLSFLFKNSHKRLFFLRNLPFTVQGYEYDLYKDVPDTEPVPGKEPDTNPLKEYFDANLEGPGIWKWKHYFDIYHMHFKKFIGKKVNIVEIGVYSGGSLKMWKSYFGPGCKIYGIDIEKDCKVYEEDNVTIYIGDQQDPDFWKKFKNEVPRIDIIIDDGSHRSEGQIVTLNELLPHLNPGGVYLCEDIVTSENRFTSYLWGLTSQLNSAEHINKTTQPTLFQASIDSINFYPYVCVIEKRDYKLSELSAEKHGTEWQPFFSQ